MSHPRNASEHRRLIAQQTLELLPPQLRPKFTAWLTDRGRRSLLPIYRAGADERKMLVEFFLREQEHLNPPSLPDMMYALAHRWVSILPAGHPLQLDRVLPELTDGYPLIIKRSTARYLEARAYCREAVEHLARAEVVWRESLDADYTALEAVTRCAEEGCRVYRAGVMSAAAVLGLDAATIRHRLLDEPIVKETKSRLLTAATTRGPHNFTGDLAVLIQDVVNLIRTKAW